MRAKLKQVHDTLLRGLCCAVWLVAFVLAFYAAIPAASGGDDAKFWAIRFAAYSMTGVSAALIHGSLLITAKDDGSRRQ